MVRRIVVSFMLFLNCTLVLAQLFSIDKRNAAGKPEQVVMDFLEHYFVDLMTQNDVTIERKMMDDKVYFRKGSIKDLRHINDSVPFVMTLLDRYYEVKWMQAGEPFVTLVFPAQYDLLLGMNQEKAQLQLKKTILAAPPRNTTLRRKGVKALLPDGIYKLETDTFLLASMSDATYYNNVAPVFDPIHPDYAAANLFAGLLTADRQMYVEQSVYGLKTVNYTLSISQWLNYCAQWGLKVYFGIEEQRADGFLAIVIAHSKELGFSHQLSVVIPDRFITDENAIMKVRMTPYIPTHNLKNLYQQPSSTKRNIKWQ